MAGSSGFTNLTITPLRKGGTPPQMESRTRKTAEDKVPTVGMVFPSLDDVQKFYSSYASSRGFSVRIQYTIKDKVSKRITKRAICCCARGVLRTAAPTEQPDKVQKLSWNSCTARIVVKLQQDGSYSVSEFNQEHKHEDQASPGQVSLLKVNICTKRQADQAVEHDEDTTDGAGIRLAPIVSDSGPRIPPSSCQTNEEGRQDYFRETVAKGGARELLQYFTRMQSTDPYFYYSLDLNEDNQVSSCFWCDGRSKLEYSYFSDIVALNTSSKRIGSKNLLAVISGINNHGNAILFGCGLLSNESTESCLWLLEAFLAAMNKRQPDTIFTSSNNLNPEAVKEVLTNAAHRICLSQIYQDGLKQLSSVIEGAPSLASDLKRFVFGSETEEQLQSSWQFLLERYQLVGSSWLQDVFRKRDRWSKAYGGQHFYSDMYTAGGMQEINLYFTKHLKEDSSMEQFFTHYQERLNKQRGKQITDDLKSELTQPKLITMWGGKNASEVYTYNIFRSFQKEYVRCLDLFLKPEGESGTMQMYSVSSYGGAGTRSVKLDGSNGSVLCSCRNFELTGILCAHVLKVLHNREISGIPPEYYMKRWTKDARTGVSVPDCQSQTVANDKTSQSFSRYTELVSLSQILVMKGASTKLSSEVVKKELTRLVVDVESYLKADPDQVREFEEIISGKHTTEVSNKKGKEVAG